MSLRREQTGDGVNGLLLTTWGAILVVGKQNLHNLRFSMGCLRALASELSELEINELDASKHGKEHKRVKPANIGSPANSSR